MPNKHAPPLSHRYLLVLLSPIQLPIDARFPKLVLGCPDFLDPINGEAFNATPAPPRTLTPVLSRSRKPQLLYQASTTRMCTLPTPNN
ncbi:hypothetical protein BDW72DRAFT_174345 [Aspergillus terricola var. indicus]